MKKLLIAVSVFAVGMAVNSCKKTVVPSSEATKMETKNLNFILQDQNGSIIDSKLATNENCYVLTEQQKDGAMKYTYFATEEDFLNFSISKGGVYAEFVYKINFAKGARAIAVKNGDDLLNGENPVYSKELTDYLATFAMNQSKGTGIFYDNSDGSGATAACTLAPRSSYGSFNNRMESYQIVGATVAYRKKLFSGGAFPLVGVGLLSTPAFANDMESSI